MASRSGYLQEKDNVIEDDGFSSLGIPLEPKQSKVILFDYDTCLFQAIYPGLNEETREPNPPFEDKDFDYLCGKLTEMTLKILNKVEEKVNILALYMFVKSGSNIRKQIYPEYKKGRSVPNPIIWRLYDFAKVAFNTLSFEGYEADDGIYTFSKKIGDNGVILGIDGDLKSIKGLNYNYNKNIWSNITYEQSIHNMYEKLCCGCTSDAVNLTPKIGIAYYNKNFKIGDSIELYEENLKKAYLKAWGNDEVKAMEMLELAKNLLLMKEIPEDLLKN